MVVFSLSARWRTCLSVVISFQLLPPMLGGLLMICSCSRYLPKGCLKFTLICQSRDHRKSVQVSGIYSKKLENEPVLHNSCVIFLNEKLEATYMPNNRGLCTLHREHGMRIAIELDFRILNEIEKCLHCTDSYV